MDVWIKMNKPMNRPQTLFWGYECSQRKNITIIVSIAALLSMIYFTRLDYLINQHERITKTSKQIYVTTFQIISM